MFGSQIKEATAMPRVADTRRARHGLQAYPKLRAVVESA